MVGVAEAGLRIATGEPLRDGAGADILREVSIER